MESFTNQDLSHAGSSARVGQIDALRALAMAAVVAEHAKLFSAGWIGVWTFYVISGFVVTASVARHKEVDPGGMSQLIKFYIRRAARIWPIYLLLVGIAAVWSFANAAPFPERAFFSLLGFYNNFALALGFGETPAFNTGHLWSISVEMQFYVLYGCVLVFGSARQACAVAIGLILACPIARLALATHLSSLGVHPLSAAFDIYSFSLLHFDAFAAGSLIAFYKHKFTVTRARMFLVLGVSIFVLYGAAYVINNVRSGAHGASILRNVYSGILFGQHREVFVYDAVLIPAAGLIALIQGTTSSCNIPFLPVLRRVGEVSYGAYVYHLPALTLTAWIVQTVFGKLGGFLEYGERLLIFLIALAATVLMAAASYRWLELPITRRVGHALKRF